MHVAREWQLKPRAKRISNCAPAIGQCEQHHAAIRGKSATIERSRDFLARNRWQIEAELIIVGHGGCGSEARRAQDGFDTHSLRKLNALRHTLSWSRLSEQLFRVDKWSVCRG